MFFVGATGQILTLILAIALPCVFLGSALQTPLQTDSFQNTRVISFVKSEITEIHTFSNTTTDQIIDNDFRQPNGILRKSVTFYPLPQNRFLSEIHLNHSGNKAPPQIILFYYCA